MTSLIDSASAILLSSERLVEASATNVANSATSGFKRELNFSEILSSDESDVQNQPQIRFLNDFTQGQLVPSDNPFDLALSGPGFLQLRHGDQQVFSRGGSFRLIADGLLADSDGRILQSTSGGDLVVAEGEVEFLEDGTVLQDGLPIGALALVELESSDAATAMGGTVFAIDNDGLRPAEITQLRQGFLEQSNVVMSDEMISMMAAIRQAEGGARIVQFYNQLVGQAIQTFSRSGR